MPTDLVSRLNLSYIYPPFLEKFLNLIAKCRAEGHDFYAVSGYRSVDEQEAKYALGRTKPGKRITNARGGFSMHCYGTAIDVASDKDPNVKGLQPDWANDKGQYAPLKQHCGEFGLQVGVPSIPGGDVGHIQLPVASCLGMQEMTALYKMRGLYLTRGDLRDVWKWLDANVKWP